ncbi:MAG TPA: MnmC family methyltransferase, partial [Flavobacteriaceae bacterium]|nr:MnmC family methyltransferase [Flavobacteriaceae bacterium]
TNAVFNELHTTAWNVFSSISTHFNLKKRLQHFESITDEDCFDLIYFDAFGARVQPELWTFSIFQKMYRALKNGGVLITYSSKSSARKAMLSLGFNVEKLPGPEGKREILRAVKN